MTHPDRYAVFGSPIKHSKSPRIHKLFAEQTGQDLIYTAQEVSLENFRSTVSDFFTQGGKGLNCTLPLKELAWQYADVKSSRAELGKAVNTLAVQADGGIFGDNTDGCGLIRDLTVNRKINLNGAKILILGAGGASRGIIAPILDHKPYVLVIANRTPEKAIQLASEFTQLGEIKGCGFGNIDNLQFDLIINATSASLTEELPPLPKKIHTEGGCCYDLAYGNQPTAFVRWGLENNARKSLDGLGMLVEQAAEAFYIWRGIRAETGPVIALLNSEREAPSLT
jgi:shikimate dehydrogenase